jgi:hypothetical protein
MMMFKKRAKSPKLRFCQRFWWQDSSADRVIVKTCAWIAREAPELR